MRRKAVFFDIDGTLFDFKTGVMDSTKEALDRLKRNGHYAFICTGRSMACIFDKELLALGFDGMVAACGTYIVFEGKELLNYEIPGERLSVIVDTIGRYEMDAVFEGPQYLYYDKESYINETGDSYMMQMERLIPERLKGVPRDPKEMHINKYFLTCRNLNIAEAGLGILEKGETIIHIASHLKEIVPAGYSKATGMDLICSRLNIDRFDTYAFGDGANDVEMLKAAGCGIAMGNAASSAKEAADYVTCSMKEHGIYFGLKEFGLI